MAETFGAKIPKLIKPSNFGGGSAKKSATTVNSAAIEDGTTRCKSTFGKDTFNFKFGKTQSINTSYSFDRQSQEGLPRKDIPSNAGNVFGGKGVIKNPFHNAAKLTENYMAMTQLKSKVLIMIMNEVELL